MNESIFKLSGYLYNDINIIFTKYTFIMVTYIYHIIYVGNRYIYIYIYIYT